MKRLICILCAALMLFACTAKKTGETVQDGAVAQNDPTKAPGPNDPAVVSADPTEAPEPTPQFTVPEIAGYDGFSDVLAAMLIGGTQNRNLSPISVYLALAMVAEGAKDETLADMLNLLGCESLEELRGVCGAMLEKLSIDTDDSTLAIADSIWMADRGGELSFNADYLRVLKDTYRSEANAVNFENEETGKQIAAWITEHTRGKIKISEDAMRFAPDTLAVLINTIYLKDAWCDDFYEGATRPGTFYGLDGEQTVDYMNRTDEGASIVRGDGFLRYSRPLLRVGRMTFILPDEGTPLSELLGSPEKLHALLHDGEAIRADVSVKLPKFKFQDRLDLNDTLTKLGIGRAFSGEADFSNMCNIPALISDVLQESYIGVDEKGVEAAAYTMVVMAEGCAEPEELPKIDFHLTRPFLYVIEARDGTVLFIGTVTAPTADGD